MKKIIPFIATILACGTLWGGTKLLNPTNIPHSITLPSTCAQGDIYQDTDATTGEQWYICESANNWVKQGGGAGVGSGNTFSPNGITVTSSATMKSGTNLGFSWVGTMPSVSLQDSSGAEAAYFNPYALAFDPGAGGGTIYNVLSIYANDGGEMYDSATNLSLSWGARTLNDASAVTALNWATRVLYDSTGDVIWDWNTGYINDLSAVVSVDFDNRNLDDDSNQRVIWATGNGSLLGSTGVNSIKWDDRTLNNTIGTSNLNWSNGIVISTFVTVSTAVTAPIVNTSTVSNLSQIRWFNGVTLTSATAREEVLVLAASDETTNLTTGTEKLTFRMPYAMTVGDVRISVSSNPTGSTLTVDVNESGTTIFSTRPTIDASEETSTTAAALPVLSDTSLADDAEITIDIDQIGSTIPGRGLKVTIRGIRT